VTVMRPAIPKTSTRRPALVLCALSLAIGASPSLAEPWRFGVMSDTQWKANLDGQNPETVAVGIIEQINRQFIAHDVKFVIQVGDLVDKETDSTNGNPANRTMDTRAAAASSLYDAGICFFPLRGNHEGSKDAAQELPSLFPQTTGSGMTCGASDFSSPDPYGNGNLAGLSYSFDYNNARFVLLDQFTRADGTNYLNSSDNNVVDQLPWIEQRLSGKGSDRHGFAFSHKNLIGANHVDTLFGSDPTKNPDAQSAYFDSLWTNGVRYHFGGHDHNHLRSIVVSPEGVHPVENIIASSNSYKFYVPQTPSIDEQKNLPVLGLLRETPIAQELFTIGYYIVTVDGPRVTVDHYASDNGCGGSLGNGQDCDLTATPNLAFEKRESFGYSLNGKEFLILQGAPYTVVEDAFEGTTAKILDGINGSTVLLHDGRETTKEVNTGWTSNNEVRGQIGPAPSWKPKDKISPILTLWGMTDLGSASTDAYTLSMRYPRSTPFHAFFYLATRDGDKWVNAVDKNSGGTKRFVVGPWKPGYPLGTYGLDFFTKTAWAVINHDGDFALARY
jgi:hypothetical protein